MLETLALNLCEAAVPNHHLTRFEIFVFKYKVIALRQASKRICAQLKFSIQKGVESFLAGWEDGTVALLESFLANWEDATPELWPN